MRGAGFRGSGRPSGPVQACRRFRPLPTTTASYIVASSGFAPSKKAIMPMVVRMVMVRLRNDKALLMLDHLLIIVKALLFIMAGLFSLLTIGSRVAGDGVLKSYHASLRVIAKNNAEARYCISNEFICAEVGRFIGLPVPPCGVVYAHGHAAKYWFASLNFNLTADELPPADTDECVGQHPDLSTGLVLFDIWIANPDRHKKNLSFDLSEKPPRMSVFDHSHALFGIENGQGIQRLNNLRDKLVISEATPASQRQPSQGVVTPYLGIVAAQKRHCLLDKLATDTFFNKWCDRIAAVPMYLIKDVCDSTVDFGMITPEEADAARDFLAYRSRNIHELVANNRHEFTAIKQWSIL